jgi:hypothetical protein
MDEEKLEYFCPFCREFILKQFFKDHAIYHRNDPLCAEYPKSLAEMKKRFEFLGMYEER